MPSVIGPLDLSRCYELSVEERKQALIDRLANSEGPFSYRVSVSVFFFVRKAFVEHTVSLEVLYTLKDNPREETKECCLPYILYLLNFRHFQKITGLKI